MILGVPAVDMASSLMALSGILMALLGASAPARATRGHLDAGQHRVLDSSTTSARSSPKRRELDPTEERTLGGNAFYRIYQSQDGRFLTLGGAESKFVTALLTALGRPDLIPLCALPPGRGQDPVRDFLTDTFAAQPLAYWTDFLGRLDVCWAPVKGVKEGLDSEHLQARGMHLVFPDGQRHLGIPIRFTNEPGAVRPVAPELGEHTREVLRESGLTEAEVEALLAR